MTSRHRDTTTPAPIERKVTWGTLGTFGASLVVALVLFLLGDPAAFGAMPKWAVSLIVALGPTVVQFASAYAAPHTPRADPAALRAAGE